MHAFATLLERLAFTPQRNGKITHLKQYFAATPDPARGLTFAALTGDLGLRSVTSSLLRGLATKHVDAQLFAMSYDFVGDLAETIALIWQPAAVLTDTPLPELVDELTTTPKSALPALIESRLNNMSATDRYAYLKLATGGLRVGVSGRLARTALAEYGNLPLGEVEEIWHGLTPPYTDLFAWAEGGEKPAAAAHAPFRPVMLSTATDPAALSTLDPTEYAAEWKWDGIRVQAVSDQGTRRLFTRTGDDISTAFPDVIETFNFDGTLDGELLIRRDGVIAPFGDLQKRLGRKTLNRKMLESHPAHMRVYDIMFWQGDDLRALPFTERRPRLEQAIQVINQPRIDLSNLLDFSTWDDLAELRATPSEAVIEGVMIKRRDSAYLAGRMKGPWFKWKRDPMLVDAVLMYAQRGHGKRSGYYSDFTFGVWDGDVLVPVGKAYFGFTDEELKALDRFVRNNTNETFGPVRALRPTKVVEVAFEGLNRSPRHKSGIAMRFPRISRIRDDKPAAEADQIQTLLDMLF